MRAVGVQCLLVSLLLLAANPCNRPLACGQAGVCLAQGSVTLSPTYEVIEGTQVVWQKPQDKPRGVLLTFHGCSHGAVDWFPASDSCKTCIGLAEELRISSTALSRGYVLLAISSRDRQFSRCWAVPHHPNTHSVDTRSVALVLSVLLPREELSGLPLYAVGASSGGAFVMTLPAFIPLAGACSQIMGLPPEWYEAFISEGQGAAAPVVPGAADEAKSLAADAGHGAGASGGGRRTPLLFVHMPRDAHTAALVAADVELRKQKGLVSHVIEVKAQPVTAAFLSQRVPELLSPEAAEQLVAVFKKQQLLDEQTGLLLHDPRSSGWRQALASSGIAGGVASNCFASTPLASKTVGLQAKPTANLATIQRQGVGNLTNQLQGAASWNTGPDVSGLSEVLNVAWAGHEIISDTTTEMLDWFEQQQWLQEPLD